MTEKNEIVVIEEGDVRHQHDSEVGETHGEGQEHLEHVGDLEEERTADHDELDSECEILSHMYQIT